MAHGRSFHDGDQTHDGHPSDSIAFSIYFAWYKVRQLDLEFIFTMSMFLDGAVGTPVSAPPGNNISVKAAYFVLYGR